MKRADAHVEKMTVARREGRERTSANAEIIRSEAIVADAGLENHRLGASGEDQEPDPRTSDKLRHEHSDSSARQR